MMGKILYDLTLLFHQFDSRTFSLKCLQVSWLLSLWFCLFTVFIITALSNLIQAYFYRITLLIKKSLRARATQVYAQSPLWFVDRADSESHCKYIQHGHTQYGSFKQFFQRKLTRKAFATWFFYKAGLGVWYLSIINFILLLRFMHFVIL